MKKALLAILVMATLGAVPAGAGDEKNLLRFNPQLVAGLGPTRGTTYRETGEADSHLGVGGTLLTLDKGGHIGLLGLGANLNTRGGDSTTVEFTCIPVRFGPFAYQFGLNAHSRTSGVDRGRLHMVTFDILGFIRLAKEGN